MDNYESIVGFNEVGYWPPGIIRSLNIKPLFLTLLKVGEMNSSTFYGLGGAAAWNFRLPEDEDVQPRPPT